MAEEKTALERLRADHQEVLKRLTAFEAVLERLPEAPDQAARAEMVGLLGFIEHEVWKHFHAEEEALFPQIRDIFPAENAPVVGGPVYVLTEEHGVLRRLVARLGQEVGRWERGEAGATAAVRQAGSQTIRAFQKHIYKEDNIVFRLTETFLSPERRALLEEAFERVMAEP